MWLGCSHGPGYATPLDAMKNGPREKLLYIVAVQPDLKHPDGDYLATVDCDPTSSTFSQVIHRTYTKRVENELHHSGWNTCSSCFDVKDNKDAAIPKRDKLICPSVNSNRIYVFDMSQDERKPVLHREIDGSVLLDNDVSAPVFHQFLFYFYDKSINNRRVTFKKISFTFLEECKCTHMGITSISR